jgi:hypothetical protein
MLESPKWKNMDPGEQKNLTQRARRKTHGDNRGKRWRSISAPSVFKSFIFAGCCAVISVLLFGTAQDLRAEGEAGTISGTVKSPTGAGISGAKVTLGNEKVSRSILTTQDGTYSFASVEAGTYTLTRCRAGVR